MTFEKEYLLRDGTVCTVRSAEADDAAAVLENFRAAHAETDNLLTYPDEIHFGVEDEEKFITKTGSDPRAVELIAVAYGRVIGTAGVSPVGGHDKIMHRAEFGISILREYWGRGIGRALTESCIECARAAGYSQLELSVVSDNTRAVRLYEHVGFTEYGRNPQGMRTRDGRYQEFILMRLEL